MRATPAATTSAPASGADNAPLLELAGVSVHYPLRSSSWLARERRVVRAVEDVSFTVRRGETLGLVGESGSGKSTTARAVLRRVPCAAGRIAFRGADITHVAGAQLRGLRRHMQLIFQDPYASLNPRMTVLASIAEPLIVHGLARNAAAARDQVAALLTQVGLPERTMDQHPHNLSGGQRQRVGIARVLTLQPELVIADEAVSALDVSMRAQVVNLLRDLQHRLGLTYLFIAHDLAVVRNISHRVAIMYAGQVVELGQRDAIFTRPRHPYTKALLSAVPVPDPRVQQARERIVLAGEIPNPASPPAGCRFHTRCPSASHGCRTAAPPFAEHAPDHWTACWHPVEAAEQPSRARTS